MTLDLYCERLGPGLLAEPVNAATNAAFLVAAWWIQARARRLGVADDPGIGALTALVVAIGVGSTLFHTFATTWALLADVLPILLFQLVFLWLYLRRRTAAGAATALLLVTLFLLATLASRTAPELLNGSLAYAPTLVVVLLLGWRERRRCGRPGLLTAGVVFSLSLLMRSVDQLLCPWLPVGTHLLWHLLNAVVLALATAALMPASPRPDAAPEAAP
ncbi:ceramidase domain-containing protein [Cyanobium sp. CH-040]|uniref:ceramidase domain-containing protein n=1 Tax=Cyanobium sp. CH-040 TaxID=2823708 RepID=UPI0020CB7AF6|nr:ceramidase domain-containing protein [Cyanobium sp. CH-040]MCP9928293.1 ceramidase domain-containing protein [Cyanobium sp. CH-040]